MFCYLELRSYRKANYPKSLPFAPKSTFAFEIHFKKHLPTPKTTVKNSLVIDMMRNSLQSNVAYKQKIFCDVKLLHDVIVDTIGYTIPISIKVALGIVLWSLKAIVWWSFKQSIVLYSVFQ